MVAEIETNTVVNHTIATSHDIESHVNKKSIEVYMCHTESTIMNVELAVF